VAQVGVMRNAYNIFLQNLKRSLKKTDASDKISKGMLKKAMSLRTNAAGSEQARMADSSEKVNKPFLGSIKYREWDFFFINCTFAKF
jgi:hypothetical protein